MKEAVAAMLSLQLQVYLYQVMLFCEPHTAAEPTAEIPYILLPISMWTKQAACVVRAVPEITDRKLTRKLVTTNLPSR